MDDASYGAFNQFIKERCTNNGYVTRDIEKGESINMGCVFGHAEIRQPFEGKRCLSDHVDITRPGSFEGRSGNAWMDGMDVLPKNDRYHRTSYLIKDMESKKDLNGQSMWGARGALFMVEVS